MNNASPTSHPRRLRGTVASARMPRTVSVKVQRTLYHEKLRRYFRRDRKFLADTATFSPSPGDQVLIEETRPLSHNKRWKVVEVLVRAAVEQEI